MKRTKTLSLVGIALSAALLAGCSSDGDTEASGSNGGTEGEELTDEQKREAQRLLKRLDPSASYTEDVIAELYAEYSEEIVFLEVQSGEDENTYDATFYNPEDEKVYAVNATVDEEELAIELSDPEEASTEFEQEILDYIYIDLAREISSLEEMSLSPISSVQLKEEDEMVIYTFTHEDGDFEYEIPVA